MSVLGLVSWEVEGVRLDPMGGRTGSVGRDGQARGTGEPCCTPAGLAVCCCMDGGRTAGEG